MKKNIVVLGLILLFLICLMNGCIEKDISNNATAATLPSIYYSNDNNTVLVYVTESSPQEIVDIINTMYENGYAYVGDVQLPWNLAGKINFYLIFRLS